MSSPEGNKEVQHVEIDPLAHVELDTILSDAASGKGSAEVIRQHTDQYLNTEANIASRSSLRDRFGRPADIADRSYYFASAEVPYEEGIIRVSTTLNQLSTGISTISEIDRDHITIDYIQNGVRDFTHITITRGLKFKALEGKPYIVHKIGSDTVKNRSMESNEIINLKRTIATNFGLRYDLQGNLKQGKK